MGNALSIAASVLCLGGILGFINAKENEKPLILNLVCASASLAVGSKLSSTFCSSEAEYQAEKISQFHELIIKQNQQDSTDLALRLTKQTTALTEAKILIQKHQQTITEQEQQLVIKENLVFLLNKQIEKGKADINAKINERDTRFEFVCQELKQVFQETLKEKIDYAYERLADMTTAKMNDTHYQNIHPTLNIFYDKLEVYRYQHYQLIKKIPELDNEELAENLSNIFLQITDELSSLKVKFRNTLNVDERDSLALALDELVERRDIKKFILKPKVDVVLDFQKNAAKEDLDKIKVQAFQSRESLREIREEVKNFIGQLEVKNEEIASLNQQIFELKKPQQFYGGGSISRAGNAISIHYYKKGYRLDCLTWEETITGYIITFGIRHNPAITEDEIYADKGKEHLTAYTDAVHPTVPALDINRQNCTLKLIVQQRVAPKKVVSPQEQVTEIRSLLRPSDSLLTFVNQAFHIGMWGETGKGKTTAISNVMGGMIQTLGTPKIRTTIPKIDADSAVMFPEASANWVGVQNSIFGLLEAALEIQYRIWINEQAYLKSEEIKDFEPIIFFIDEINLIFSRWKKVVEADLEDVLSRFMQTLSGERKEYFVNHMQTELHNYKGEFAKRLLMFIWQTGRSLRVKSLIAGQNLQPGALGLMAADLTNCAYIAFGDSKTKCSEYKVKSGDLPVITEQIKLLENAVKTDSNLQYTGLFCPSVGSSFLSVLPAPNTYRWGSPQGLNKVDIMDINEGMSSLKRIHNNEWMEMDRIMDKTVDIMDGGQKNVHSCPPAERLHTNTFQPFSQVDKLQKQYQNMGFEGCVQLWAKLPKKKDGTVFKLEAYKQVFKVTRSDERKIYSEFIDYLEKLCNY